MFSWIEFFWNDNNSVVFWELYVWEYSSVLSIVLFVILLIIVICIFDYKVKVGVIWFGWYFVFVSLFLVVYVLLMVVFWKFVYLFFECNYDFGIWFNEFIYEYWKDVWGYIILIIFYYIVWFGY